MRPACRGPRTRPLRDRVEPAWRVVTAGDRCDPAALRWPGFARVRFEGAAVWCEAPTARMNPVDLWNTTVALSPVVGALAAWLRSHRADTARSRPSAAVVVSLDGATDGARVAVSGRLLALRAPNEQGRAVAVFAETTLGAVQHGSVAGLRVVLADGAEVPIEGALRVVAGSREGPPWSRLGDVEVATVAWLALLRSLSQTAVRNSTGAVRVLCHDDPVIACGCLQARPDAVGGDGAYREAGVRYVLVPDGAAVTLHGRGARRPRRGLRVVGGAALAAFAAVSLLLAVGLVASGFAGGGRQRVAWDGARWYSSFRGSTRAVTVAMVSPFERRRAHHTLGEALWHQRRPTRADLSSALGELVTAGDCQGAVDMALERGLVREAQHIAARGPCAAQVKPWQRAIVAYAAGDFAAGSDALAPDRTFYVDLYASYIDDFAFDVRLHLLAGNEALAARVARQRAVWERGRRVVWGDAQTRAATFDCLADRFEATHGDPLAMRRLREAARGGAAMGACGALLLDALEPVERRAWEGRFATVTPTRVGTLLLHEGEVAWARPIDPCSEPWSDLLTAPAAAMARRSPGIEHGMARAPGFGASDDVWRTHVDVMCSLAAFEALAGDRAAARRALGDAAARVGEASRTTGAPWAASAMQGITTLSAAVALTDGDNDAAAAIVHSQRRPDVVTDEGWNLIARRDARGSAEHLYTHAWNALPLWLVYGAPRLTRTPALATWLGTIAPPPCVRCTVRQRLAELAAHRTVARALGAVGPDDVMTAAFARALRERRLAVPLRVLDDLRESAGARL